LRLSCLCPRSPPSSTLSPYTTLFRSSLRARTRIAGRQHVGRRAFGLRLQDRSLALLVEVPEEVQPVVRDVVQRHEQAGLLVVVVDRKSTRLNSSHQIISYAVFCLKK